MTLVEGTEQLRQILDQSKVVAVVGFNDDTVKPAYFVPEYLYRQGYTIIPVNPKLLGTSFFGQKSVAHVQEIHAAVDIVLIFRRSEMVGEHVADILNMKRLPPVVWMQLGVENEEAAKQLSAAGIGVIQNRCMLTEHRALT